MLQRRLEYDSDHNGIDRVSLAIWKGHASLPIIGTMTIWRAAASLKPGHKASITKAIGGKAREKKKSDAATGSKRLARQRNTVGAGERGHGEAQS